MLLIVDWKSEPGRCAQHEVLTLLVACLELGGTAVFAPQPYHRPSPLLTASVAAAAVAARAPDALLRDACRRMSRSLIPAQVWQSAEWVSLQARFKRVIPCCVFAASSRCLCR